MPYRLPLNILSIGFYIAAVVDSFIGAGEYAQLLHLMLGTMCLCTVAIIDAIEKSR